MAIRELVTAFTFQTDLSGLNDYNRALEKTKVATEKAFDTSKLTAGLEKLSGVAFKLTNMMGLTFAIGAMDQLASKAFDYVKEIIHGAQESKRLNAQIELIIGNTAQAKQVQEGLYDLAQKTGMEYNDVAEMSKGILIASKEQKIPFEESTKAISNFVLALKVGKASTQETAEAVGSLEQGLRLGKIGPRAIGRLIQGPAGQFLADQLTGGNLDKLRADAAKKGFSIKRLIEGLAKPSAALDAKVAKLPFTIGRAFADIKNDITKAAEAVMKLTAGFGGLGKIIWGIFSFAKGAVLGFINTLGGLKNTIELVGIALAVALGPLLIRNIILATASLVQMAIASWTVWLPWAAIGIAIAVAALAIQDFMVWMRNPNAKTVFGDMLGPFDEFKKKIEEFPIVKIFEGLTSFLSGDFGKGFEQIVQGFKNITDPATAVATIVTVIGGAFIGWEALTFVGIIGALGTLAKAFIPVKIAAAETTAAIETTAAAAGAGAAAKGGAGTPTVVPGAGPRANKSTLPGKVNKALLLSILGFDLLENLGVTNTGIDKDMLNNMALGASIGSILGLPGTIGGAAIGGLAGNKTYHDSTIASQQPIPTLSNDPIERKDMPDVSGFFKWLRDAVVNSVVNSQDPIPAWNAPVTKEDLPAPIGPTSSLFPRVMPFDGMAGKSIEQTVNAGGIIQNNNINVTAQMNEDQVAQAVRAQVASQAPDLLDKVSRQIADAIPRTERATA